MGKRAGKGALIQYRTEVHCVCYAIGAYDSKAWKSGNPLSGVYETEVAKTLDAISCGYPGCNQGGIAIVEIRDIPKRNPHRDDKHKEHDCDERHMPDAQSTDGYWGGNVPLILEVGNDTDNAERSGGGVMSWNYKELAATLRAEMSSHPPIVVTDESDMDDSRPPKPYNTGRGGA